MPVQRPPPLEGLTPFSTLTRRLWGVWGGSPLHLPQRRGHQTKRQRSWCDLADMQQGHPSGRGLQMPLPTPGCHPLPLGRCREKQGAGSWEHSRLLQEGREGEAPPAPPPKCFKRRFWLLLRFVRNLILSVCAVRSRHAYRVEPRGPGRGAPPCWSRVSWVQARALERTGSPAPAPPCPAPVGAGPSAGLQPLAPRPYAAERAASRSGFTPLAGPCLGPVHPSPPAASPPLGSAVPQAAGGETSLTPRPPRLLQNKPCSGGLQKEEQGPRSAPGIATAKPPQPLRPVLQQPKSTQGQSPRQQQTYPDYRLRAHSPRE